MACHDREYAADQESAGGVARAKPITARPSVARISTLLSRLVTNQSELGRRLHVGQSKVSKWCSVVFDDTPSLARTDEMCTVAPDVVRGIIAHLEARLGQAPAPPRLSLELHALNVATESGDIARSVRTMLEDADVTRDELLALRREVAESQREHAAFLAAIDHRLDGDGRR